MSRLATRLDLLEQRLGPCRECRPVLELSREPCPLAPERQCEACGQPVETITVVVAFDPGEGGRP